MQTFGKFVAHVEMASLKDPINKCYESLIKTKTQLISRCLLFHDKVLSLY